MRQHSKWLWYQNQYLRYSFQYGLDKKHQKNAWNLFNLQSSSTPSCTCLTNQSTVYWHPLDNQSTVYWHCWTTNQLFIGIAGQPINCLLASLDNQSTVYWHPWTTNPLFIDIPGQPIICLLASLDNQSTVYLSKTECMFNWKNLWKWPLVAYCVFGLLFLTWPRILQ